MWKFAVHSNTWCYGSFASEGLNRFVVFQLEVLGLSIRSRSIWIFSEAGPKAQSPEGRAEPSAFHPREGIQVDGLVDP